MESPCDSCFIRRVKCDRCQPCLTCRTRSQKCTYVRIRKRPGPKGPRLATNRKIEEIQEAPQPDFKMAAALQHPTALCSWDFRISIANYYTVLGIFQVHLYDVWPIIDVEHLKLQLNSEKAIDPSSHALAAALCAATLAQTRLWLTKDTCPEGLAVTAHEFLKECLRVRLEHSYNQAPSLQALVTSIFLHMYYANQDQVTPATISLREAITYADLMHLCHHGPPNAAEPRQRQLELRCYWVLFITERLALTFPAKRSLQLIFLGLSASSMTFR